MNGRRTISNSKELCERDMLFFLLLLISTVHLNKLFLAEAHARIGFAFLLNGGALELTVVVCGENNGVFRQLTKDGI